MIRLIRGTNRRIPIILAGTALTVAVAKAEHDYSNIDDVADAYITLMLAANTSLEKQPKLQEQLINLSIQRQLSQLDHRVQWSLQKHRLLQHNNAMWRLLSLSSNDDDEEEDTDLAVYRLEWMVANLRGVSFQLERQGGGSGEEAKKTRKKVPFDEESVVLYDTHVDEAYLDPSLTTARVHAKLHELLPGKKPLHEKHAQFQSRIMIPKKNYESIFRKLVDDILESCESLIPELASAKVTQQYLDDKTLPCEAWVQPDICNGCSPGDSKMVVNIARAISFDKAQQLAVHELTHHFQIVLMEQCLYDKCPEMRVNQDMGPLGIILEGGAEAMVELYFNPEAGGVVDRIEDLEKRLPTKIRNLISADKILQVERLTWFGLWPTIVQIARNYQNGTIDKDECIRKMLEQALKRHYSWPNADFFDDVGAYTLGYGYGKELILQYCTKQALKNKDGSILQEYIKFMKRPLLPSQMQRELSG